MLTFVVTLIALLVLIALLSIRIILIPGGEFRGSCSSNNPFLRREGESCPGCGKEPDKNCSRRSKSVATEA